MKNSNEYIQYTSRQIEDPLFQQPILNKTYQKNISYPNVYYNNIDMNSQINIHTHKPQIQVNTPGKYNNINNIGINKQNNVKSYPYEDISTQNNLLKSKRNENNINYSKSLKTINISNQNKIKKNKKKISIIDKVNIKPLIQRNTTALHTGIIPNSKLPENHNVNNEIKYNNSMICTEQNVNYHEQLNNINQSSDSTVIDKSNYYENIYYTNMNMNNCINYNIKSNYNIMNQRLNYNNEYMQSLIQFGCFNVGCNFMGASRSCMNNIECYDRINGMLEYDNEKLLKQFEEDMKKINGK